jgi:hypothetical protein
MKSILLGIILMAQSQDLIANLIPGKNYFEGITEQEARTFITGASGGEMIHRFVQEALINQRLDLIQVSVEYNYSRSYLYDEILTIPDSVFKDLTAIIMMRSPMWVDAGPVAPRLGGGYGSVMVEPFVSLIKKYYPNLELTESLLLPKEARLKLAENLQTAVARRYGLKLNTAIDENDDKTLTLDLPRPKKDRPQPQSNSDITMTNSDPKLHVLVPINQDPQLLSKSMANPLQIWLFGGSAIVILLVMVKWLKSRKSKLINK